MSLNIVAQSRLILQAHALAENAEAMNSYFKGVVKCHGVRSAVIDVCLQQLLKEHPHLIPSDPAQYWDACGALIESEYGEEKELGVRLLARKVKQKADKLTPAALRDFTPTVYRGVNNWSTCDSFCSRVLRPMLEDEWHARGEKSTTLAVLTDWNKGDSLWQQRASCVALVIPARHGMFIKQSFEHVERAVESSDERFVQLGAGWLMRELTVVSKDRAIQSLLNNGRLHWSREGLRYAVEKLKPEERQRILKGTKHKRGIASDHNVT